MKKDSLGEKLELPVKMFIIKILVSVFLLLARSLLVRCDLTIIV